jgi:hypothetical protein
MIFPRTSTVTTIPVDGSSMSKTAQTIAVEHLDDWRWVAEVMEIEMRHNDERGGLGFQAWGFGEGIKSGFNYL